MKKRNLVFILALTLFMLIANFATAGPAPVQLSLFESATPAILVTPARAPTAPLLSPAYFTGISSSPSRNFSLSSMPLLSSGKTDTYAYAVMATPAGLIWGIGLAIVTARLKYDIRDRMHRLPRDQDATA